MTRLSSAATYNLPATVGVPNDSRFAWLLSPRAIAEPPLPTEQAVAEACEFALRCWRVLPVVAPALRAWAGPSLPPHADARMDRLATSVSTLARLQTMLALRFTNALERVQIPYTLLKAAAARLTIYDHPGTRGGMDVDVAVPPSAIREAEAVAQELGFVSSMLVGDDRRHYTPVTPTLKTATEAAHYELATLARRQVVTGLDADIRAAIEESIPYLLPWHVRDGTIGCYITIDLHHGLSLDIPVEEIVASAATRQTVWGGAARVPATHWHIFHLIFKLYWEGVHNYAKGVYQYADLARLVPRLDHPGTQALIELLGAYRLEAAALYVLRRLEPHFGVALPPALMTLIDQAAACPEESYPHEVNDLGDMWPKIWGYR